MNKQELAENVAYKILEKYDFNEVDEGYKFSDIIHEATKETIDACMTELAKQSGFREYWLEFKTFDVIWTGCPTTEDQQKYNFTHVIDHAAILAANAKIQELEDFRQAQVEEIKRCDSNLKLLNNKIKELEQELKTKTLQFEKAFEVNQECNRKLQEAEKVIEFIADEFVEWSKMKERARTYLQNKGE